MKNMTRIGDINFFGNFVSFSRTAFGSWEKPAELKILFSSFR